MPIRILLLVLTAAALSSCADDSTDRPKMKQVARTNAMGQTTYSYRPVDEPSGQ